MNRLLAVLIALTILMSSCALNIQKHHALYGERKFKWTVQDRTVRVFMDKEGLYYPDAYIKDKELKRVNGSLREWYHKNPVQLTAVCKQYNVDASGSDQDAVIDRLNDAIIKTTAETINTNMYHFTTLNVLVHGYRRKGYNSFPGITRTSRKENQKLAGSLTLGSYRDVLYLEVYWDGYFFGRGHNAKDMANAFHSYATPNAVNAGLGLRKLLTRIKKNKEVNIVTHSLGAVVGCEALFNASGAVLPEANAAENNISTPGVNNIKLCMIAPAIGSDVLAKYNSRNPDSATGKDNYQLSIAYNEYDYALLKQYKGAVLSYGRLSPVDSGNTSLGCNYQGDIGKAMGIVAPATIDTFNFSKCNKKKAKGQFLISTYLKNTTKFAEMADHLGEKKADEEAYAKILADRIKNLKGAEKRAYEAKMRAEARVQLEAKRKADGIAREKARKEREKERAAAEKQRMKEREKAAAERKAAERQRMKEREIASKEKAAERMQQTKEKENERRAAEKAKAQERAQKEAEKKAAEREKAAEKKAAEKAKADEKRATEKAKAEEKKQAEAERRAAEKEKNKK